MVEFLSFARLQDTGRIPIRQRERRTSRANRSHPYLTSTGADMKSIVVVLAVAGIAGCATLTEDAMTPIALSFSDGSNGKCQLSNKRGSWSADVPGTVSVRKSDDALALDCETEDGREAKLAIASEMGGKIVASAVFLDFGITDAITDKHRKYAQSFVIPIRKCEGNACS